jgi:NitT/TauT family transport system ATP-binding protein
MLEVVGLTKQFGTLSVLDDFYFQVPRQGFTVLIGPSGCGKSTLFDVLMGVVPKDAGLISWCGEPLAHLGRKAAYMQQRDLLLPWLPLLENALLPARIVRADTLEARRKARELFIRLGLEGFEAYFPSEVSGGMRQRCALVRTLMFNHELVLLDEPLSALDAITRRNMQALLLMMQAEFHCSLLMITHDIEEALLLADDVLILSRTPMRILEQFELETPKPRSMQDGHLVEIKETVLQRLQRECGL